MTGIRGPPGPDAADHIEPVAVRKHHVEQDQIRPRCRRDAKRLAAAGRRHHVEAREPQRPRQQFQDGRLVLDY
jgi:hypothetical protein